MLLDNTKVWSIVNVIVYNLPVQWRVFDVLVIEIFLALIISSVATSGRSLIAFMEPQDTLHGQLFDKKVESC